MCASQAMSASTDFASGSSRHPLLVLPVRGDTVLGLLVHLVGADLDLDGAPPGPITVVCSDW
jgi:hypothetical protein